MRHGKGHTLIEMLISISIISIIMLGLGSVMLIASKALPDTGNPADTIITASVAAEQLESELKFAVTFSVRDANTVEFTVADRNGDDIPETIRYTWSGTAGDPLTRQYNGGTVFTVAEDVNDFFLDYHTKTVSNDEGGGGLDSYHNMYADVRLQVGDDSTSRIDTAVQTLNALEVAAL